jgi:hypothetical protein
MAHEVSGSGDTGATIEFASRTTFFPHAATAMMST